MEHEHNLQSTEHASHEGHAHLHHEHHQDPAKKKMEQYGVMVAFVIGIIAIALNAASGNFFYAFTVLGALGVIVTLYMRKYLAATLLASVLILIITIVYRVSLLQYFGFYEPDGFYHYSVIRAAIMHNFVVPTYLSISGWPHTAPVVEPTGFYWVTLLPYLFLQFLGISYYDIMRLVPIFFALVDIVGTYYLIRELNKDRAFGLLGMLFVGLSMGDAARTSGGVYRGDGFVTIFVILGLIFMIRTLKSQDRKAMLYNALLTGLMLSLGNLVWNGASFGIAIYIFALALILLYAFLTEKSQVLEKSRYLMIALAFWYVLSTIYKVLNLIGTQNEAFTGIYFLVLFFFLVLGNEMALFLIKNKERFAVYVKSMASRFATFVAFSLAVMLLIYFLAPQIVFSIFVGNGFGTSVAFAASIEELQPPTPAFLFASFGATLFMAPMSIMLYLSTFYPNMVDIFWIALMVISVMYFFMDYEGVEGGKFLSGKIRLRFHVNEALLVILAYYALTAYLQMHAVRFNSLLSIPLAIFTAYTMYWVLLFLKNFNNFSFFLGLGLLAVLIGYIMIVNTGYSLTLIQADNINPTFIQALNWIKANTPQNAVILTLWPDGSLVEGVANRTSVTDSVGSQNRSKAGPFAIWLFNTTPNGKFLTSSINGRPDYILVRYTWMLETSGIYTETEFNSTNFNQSLVRLLLNYRFNGKDLSQLNPNQTQMLNALISQLYAYNLFNQFQEQVNGTNQIFTFTNPSQGIAAKVIVNSNNGTQAINSYLYVGQGVSPFRYVVFYNQVDGNYQIVQQNYNATNNQTMVIQYSSIPKPGAFVNLTGAYMMNLGLSASNMFKLLFACGPTQCSWNNKYASLRLVYVNPDTKLFRVIYNTTAS